MSEGDRVPSIGTRIADKIIGNVTYTSVVDWVGGSLDGKWTGEFNGTLTINQVEYKGSFSVVGQAEKILNTQGLLTTGKLFRMSEGDRVPSIGTRIADKIIGNVTYTSVVDWVGGSLGGKWTGEFNGTLTINQVEYKGSFSVVGQAEKILNTQGLLTTGKLFRMSEGDRVPS